MSRSNNKNPFEDLDKKFNTKEVTKALEENLKKADRAQQQLEQAQQEAQQQMQEQQLEAQKMAQEVENIEKEKLDAHKKRMKTYFKFGGKIHDARMATGIVKKEGEKWEHKQRD